MIVNAVTYRIREAEIPRAIELFRKLRIASLAESGCRVYTVNRVKDDPAVFFLYEEWADQAALSAHYETPHFTELGINGIRTLAESRVGLVCEPLA